MPSNNHIIIYSHGFGVQKDDLGLLTGIAAGIPEAESILFDYYEINDVEKTLTICPFSVQVEKLNQVIKEARQSNPEAIIDLICHSQGNIVAALVKPEGIRKAVLLAPPFDMGLERTLERYRSKPDAKINLDGISIIPSTEGLTRIIPAEYWKERLTIKPFEEYNSLAENTDVTIVIANNDQLLPPVDLKDLDKKIKVLHLDGDHNFNGPARDPLIKTIRNVIL